MKYNTRTCALAQITNYCAAKRTKLTVNNVYSNKRVRRWAALIDCSDLVQILVVKMDTLSFRNVQINHQK